jgi:ribosomal protein S27AE
MTQSSDKKPSLDRIQFEGHEFVLKRFFDEQAVKIERLGEELEVAESKRHKLREVLKSADLFVSQSLYVGSMEGNDYETWQENGETCWNEIRQALAEDELVVTKDGVGEYSVANLGGRKEPPKIEFVINLSNEKCPSCGSTAFMAARDMIGTKHCVRCHHQWVTNGR